MNTLLAVLFTATLGNAPMEFMNTAKNGDITYVSFVQEGNLMLVKLNKDLSYRSRDIVDTGISTKEIEDITMNVHDAVVDMTVRYADRSCVIGQYDSRTLDMLQISNTDLEMTGSVSSLQ